MRHTITGMIFITAMAMTVFPNAAVAQSRKLDVSDVIPEFSVVDTEGMQYDYPNDEKAILLVAFVSPSKPKSLRALKELESVIGSIENNPNSLTVIYVTDEPNSLSSLNIASLPENTKIRKHTVLDRDYHLWGTFGVIASPTVFLAGQDRTITLAKAGYGYDFAPVIKSSLLRTLGMSEQASIVDPGQVKTISNDTISMKALRHLKMAKMLQEKQQYDAAIKQLEQAVQIDPNSTDSLLELGLLYCTVSQPQKALDLVKDIEIEQDKQKALRNFILGKGYFILKQYDPAGKYLTECIEMNPRNAEAYYLLGRIYHIQNDLEKAVEAYYKSLHLMYNP